MTCVVAVVIIAVIEEVVRLVGSMSNHPIDGSQENEECCMY